MKNTIKKAIFSLFVTLLLTSNFSNCMRNVDIDLQNKMKLKEQISICTAIIISAQKNLESCQEEERNEFKKIVEENKASKEKAEKELEEVLKREEENKEKAKECPICLEEKGDNPFTDEESGHIVRVEILPCGHAFCGGCIKEWWNNGNKCPVCNTTKNKLDRMGEKLKKKEEKLEKEIFEKLMADLERSPKPQVNQAPTNLINININDFPVPSPQSPTHDFHTSSVFRDLNNQRCNELNHQTFRDHNQSPRNQINININNRPTTSSSNSSTTSTQPQKDQTSSNFEFPLIKKAKKLLQKIDAFLYNPYNSREEMKEILELIRELGIVVEIESNNMEHTRVTASVINNMLEIIENLQIYNEDMFRLLMTIQEQGAIERYISNLTSFGN